MANTRSRLRMLTLYAYATIKGVLVCGTGNKVEDFGVGFYTKYGDGGVDISPIADLMKSEVYDIARHLNISKTILEAPPTDGLWDDDRTDEDQIGATYRELEIAMKIQDQFGIDPPQNAFSSQREKDVWGIYRSRHLANKHKMIPIPVCTIPDAYRNPST
jgi:NAD+ synthase